MFQAIVGKRTSSLFSHGKNSNRHHYQHGRQGLNVGIQRQYAHACTNNHLKSTNTNNTISTTTTGNVMIPQHYCKQHYHFLQIHSSRLLSSAFSSAFPSSNPCVVFSIVRWNSTTTTTTTKTAPKNKSNDKKKTNNKLAVDDKNKSRTKDIKFVVSILGPPNAGKSTLFNRLQCKEKNKTYRLKTSNNKNKNKRKKKGGTGGGRISSKFTSHGNAIVSSIAGTTRDRRECHGRIGGTEFILMDTAGVDGDRINLLKNTTITSSTTTTAAAAAATKMNSITEKHALERAMMEQTLEAAKQSDLVLLMWDAKVGVTQDLAATARWLRKLGKDHTNVAVLANKLEGDAWVYGGGSNSYNNNDNDSMNIGTTEEDLLSPVLQNIKQVERLGLGEVIPISALHGDGMADIAILIEQLKAEKLEEEEEEEYDDDGDDITEDEENEETTTTKKPLQLAVLGRQNVGKSTLVNALLQDDRVLTGPTPGLTRDAIAVEFTWQDHPIQLVDTAGIRKLTKRMDDTIEDMSVADALRAMKVAEVAILVLDAEALYIQRQELAICNAIYEEGRAIVIAANKMDLLELSNEFTPDDFANAVRGQIEERIPILRKIPVVPMSCKSGYGVTDLLPVVMNAKERWARTLSTGILNRWLREVVQGAPPPIVNGVAVKLKYIIQTKGRPPTFIIFTNVSSPIPETYLRYLTRHFQDSFEFFGMPIRMVVQQSAQSNPYNNKNDNNNKDGRKRSGFGLGGRKGRQQRRVQEYIKKSRMKRKETS